jgi:Protein of unknown function (DUF4232)
VNDIDDDVRELLRQKAQDVPPHQEVPRSLVPRVRRRIAVNVLAVGATAIVLTAGLFVGVRALNVIGPAEPIGPGPSPSVEPTTTTSTAAPCTARELRAIGSMEGAAGSREGAAVLTNLSSTTCTLQGTPTIMLLDRSLDPITSGLSFVSSPPRWMVDRLPKPAGWPVVTLAPFDSASVRIQWGNWCPDGRAAPLWRIQIPGGGTVDVNGLEAVSPPPCNGPGLPSTIQVGPFEPGTGT